MSSLLHRVRWYAMIVTMRLKSKLRRAAGLAIVGRLSKGNQMSGLLTSARCRSAREVEERPLQTAPALSQATATNKGVRGFRPVEKQRRMQRTRSGESKRFTVYEPAVIEVIAYRAVSKGQGAAQRLAGRTESDDEPPALVVGSRARQGADGGRWRWRCS